MSERQDAGRSGGIHVSRVALLGFAIAILAAAVMMAAALGYRLGLWSFRFALLTLTDYAAYAAFAGVAISLVGFGRSLPSNWVGMALSVVGVIVGGYSCHTIYQQWITVKSVPFIHDITTDTDNPPQFKAVVEERVAETANPHEYAGRELAFQQQCGYPDLGPYLTEASAEAAFDSALETANEMGWDIVEADRELGRIEATDASFWYGFKDDVVVRITLASEGAGTRIDVRSLSRSGRSDVGVNASRVKSYLAAVNEEL